MIKEELEVVEELKEIEEEKVEENQVSLNTDLLKDFRLTRRDNQLMGRNRKERRIILSKIRKLNKKRKK